MSDAPQTNPQDPQGKDAGKPGDPAATPADPNAPDANLTPEQKAEKEKAEKAKAEKKEKAKKIAKGAATILGGTAAVAGAMILAGRKKAPGGAGGAGGAGDIADDVATPDAAPAAAAAPASGAPDDSTFGDEGTAEPVAASAAPAASTAGAVDATAADGTADAAASSDDSGLGTDEEETAAGSDDAAPSAGDDADKAKDKAGASASDLAGPAAGAAGDVAQASGGSGGLSGLAIAGLVGGGVLLAGGAVAGAGIAISQKGKADDEKRKRHKIEAQLAALQAAQKQTTVPTSAAAAAAPTSAAAATPTTGAAAASTATTAAAASTATTAAAASTATTAAGAGGSGGSGDPGQSKTQQTGTPAASQSQAPSQQQPSQSAQQQQQPAQQPLTPAQQVQQDQAQVFSDQQQLAKDQKALADAQAAGAPPAQIAQLQQQVAADQAKLAADQAQLAQDQAKLQAAGGQDPSTGKWGGSGGAPGGGAGGDDGRTKGQAGPTNLNKPQQDALAGAVGKSTGLPPDQVNKIIADSTVGGKLDASQLLGNLQNAKKPLDGKALVDAIKAAGDALGSPAGDALKAAADAIAGFLGLKAGPADDAKGKAAVERQLQEIAKALRNALKNAAKNKKDEEKDNSAPAPGGRAVCKLHKDGKPLEIDQSKILTCVVNLSTEMVDSFQITMTDNDLKLSSDKTFAEGEKIGIELGWRSGGSQVVMIGQITGRELDFPRRGPVLLTVHGLAFEHRLNRGRFTRAFCKAPGEFQTTDKDIAAQIAQDAGLQPTTLDDPGIKYEYVFQNNMTNLEFLRQRAAFYNYEVCVTDGDKFHFRKPAIKKAPPMKLKRGQNLKHFRACMSLTSQVAEVQVRGWSPKDKKEITGKATKTDIQDRMDLQKIGPEILADYLGKAGLPAPGPDGTVSVVVATPVISAEQATAVAKSVLNYYAMGFVSGDGSTWGDPKIKAGGMLQLEKVGKRFEGLYYLKSVSHVYEGQGYTTMFEVYRPGVTPAEHVTHPPHQTTPPQTTQPPVKTFFEFLAEGLRQIPLAQAPAMSRRTTDPGAEPEMQETPLDGAGMIKKPSVEPGLYNVQIREVVGGSWALGDVLPPVVPIDTKNEIEDLRLKYRDKDGKDTPPDPKDTEIKNLKLEYSGAGGGPDDATAIKNLRLEYGGAGSTTKG